MRWPIWRMLGSEHALRGGWRAGLHTAWWGVPSGPVGWLGARALPVVAGRLYVMMSRELGLRPADALLDVGCGSGGLLAAHPEVEHVAGVDLSPIQVRLARRRLAERLAAGTAQVVLGDAAALPWRDGGFSAVASLNCLCFVPDPDVAVQEMARVLRPGGRVVLTLFEEVTEPGRSGTLDDYGMWQWSAPDARAMMARAGFDEVQVRQLGPEDFKVQVVTGRKPA